jgi:hypothetical protein
MRNVAIDRAVSLSFDGTECKDPSFTTRARLIERWAR